MARILIADDEKEVRDLVSFILSKDGHEIHLAEDGVYCLSQARSMRPDLILLDVMMPQMDGYTVFTKLSEFEETRNIPVIVLTAKGGAMKDVFQMAANVLDYVAKPFDPIDLRERVRHALTQAKR